jgi:hypothetical protein
MCASGIVSYVLGQERCIKRRHTMKIREEEKVWNEK